MRPSSSLFWTRASFTSPCGGTRLPKRSRLPSSTFPTFAEARDRLYTYAWKTDRALNGNSRIQMLCPAPLDQPHWRAQLETIAVKAYRAVGLRDYGRFDMRMLGDEPQILDVNCNPELWTDDSVFVAAAKARGMCVFGGDCENR